MKNYSDYTPEELASDLDFIKWTKKSEQTSDILALEQWINSHPEKAKVVADAKLLINEIAVSGENLGQAKTSVWDRIQSSIDTSPVIIVEKEAENGEFHYWKIAAVIALIAVATIVFFIVKPQDEMQSSRVTSTEQGHIFQNQSSVPKTVFLDDGTSVILFENSSLIVAEDFNDDERNVQVDGKAFFEVLRDESRPFIVQTNEITTRVLGTSFLVTAYDDTPVTVSVNTGKVEVYSNDTGDADENNVVLEPNEQVSYDRMDQLLIKSVISKSKVEIEMNEDFVFSNKPLSDVFSLIEDRYGVKVIYDKKRVKECRINASLVGIPLDQKMRLICKVSNLEFSKTATSIKVTGVGCVNDQ